SSMIWRFNTAGMKPAPILEILFNLGRLGNKSGAGFYNNGSDEELVKIVEDNFTDRRNLSLDDGFDRMLAGQLLEVLRCLEEDIATPEDIEKGCRHGINWPLARDEGPLHYIQNTLGLTDLLEMSKQARDSSQYADRFIPPAILEEMVTKGENKFFEDEEDW
ncbi:MAG: 3-hydroxyacyl-CoA dehydrogenase family protein, partial [Candidatus Paceibacterota bacterium]